MTTPRLVTIDHVVAELAARAQSLVLELLPGGRRHGHEWCVGSLAGEPGKKLCVHLDGPKAGVWKDFAGTAGGDAFDLVAQVLFRGDKREAFKWAMRWLGLEAGDPAALAVRRQELAEQSEQNDRKAAEEAERKRRAAHRIWLAGTPVLAGSPVEYYLAGRGIDLAVLGREPGALRFGANVWCDEVRGYLPAMLAAVGAPGRGFIACHRTYLQQHGRGDWRKADVKYQKMTLGSWKGGSISLQRGASGKPFTQAPAGEIVDLTEGIENALSVAMAAPEARVIAGVTLGNLGLVELPEGITHLRVWQDNDTKAPALARFDDAMCKLLTRGLTVDIVRMPAGVKDANELLQREA